MPEADATRLQTGSAARRRRGSAQAGPPLLRLPRDGTCSVPKRGSLSGGAVKAGLSRLPRRFLGGFEASGILLGSPEVFWAPENLTPP
eukprot:14729631-Alexandrium_andersonii.AAC.1